MPHCSYPVTLTVNSNNEKIVMNTPLENIQEMRLEHFKIVNLPLAVFPPTFLYVEISNTYTNAEHETNTLTPDWTSVNIFPPPSRCFPLDFKIENQGLPAAPGYNTFTVQGRQKKPYYSIKDFRRLSDLTIKLYGEDCLPLTFGADTVAQFKFTVTVETEGSNNLKPEHRVKVYNKFHS